MQQLRAKDVLHHPFTSHFLKNIGEGILVGLVTGLVVATFRWIIDRTLEMLAILYPYMRTHQGALIIYVLGSVGIGLIIARLLKGHVFDIVGSGVPQIEGVMMDAHWMQWWPVLWRKYVLGLLAICPGLFLGREGPCIQMGAAIGQGFAKEWFHSTRRETILLMSCGVAAGLSAAFSAPLAGALFLLEEITFSFRPRVWLTALSAAIAADGVTLIFFGTRPCLWLPVTQNLPGQTYLPLILFGLVLGILAWLYQYFLLNSHYWYGKIQCLPKNYQALVPLLLVIPIGLWQPHLLGGSHVLINMVAQMPQTANRWKSLAGILVTFFIIRFVFSMVSYGAAVPGGIFMPILVLGALLGALAAIPMIEFHLMPTTTFVNLVVIGMAAYFGAIEQAPFTAVCLLTEMVGTVEQVLPMLIVTFVAYTVTETLGGRPIYAALREEMLPETIKKD